MLACPQCGGTSQVLQLEAFWRSLSQDAEAKRDLAQPPAYEARWLWVLGGVAVGVWMMTVASLLYGTLLLLGSLAVGWWMWQATAAADAARARWARALYCRRCPATFDPEDGKVM
ncbi:hypothetical protein [Streptomyces sp. NPDC002758]